MDIYTTFGEGFICGLENTSTKGLLFAFLQESVGKNYPQYNIIECLDKMSDFDSVTVYQNKLARIRIDYNAKATQEIQDKLIGFNNVGTEDYKHKEQIVRKLNLLVNNHPTIEDILYIAMALYIAKSYGNVKDFKKDLKNYVC